MPIREVSFQSVVEQMEKAQYWFRIMKQGQADAHRYAIPVAPASWPGNTLHQVNCHEQYMHGYSLGMLEREGLAVVMDG